MFDFYTPFSLANFFEISYCFNVDNLVCKRLCLRFGDLKMRSIKNPRCRGLKRAHVCESLADLSGPLFVRVWCDHHAAQVDLPLLAHLRDLSGFTELREPGDEGLIRYRLNA